MKMDEYIMHDEYYKSIRGEDGEEPLAVHGSRPRTDLGSYSHSGPPSTASLPRRLRPEYPTPRAPEVGPTRVEEHHPRPTYGALDQTAELLAKFLSGSEDPDVTALSEAIKAKLLLCYQKDVLELCPRSFDVFLQVGFVVENPKPKQQVEQGLNMDRINEINDWFWNPV